MNFLQYCNSNTFNIKFTLVVDEHKLVFLDLELTHDNEGNIITCTHFKSTAGNSYLHQKSCHTKWKKDIPFSQFCRLQRNNTNEKNYEAQATILFSNFEEKVYNRKTSKRSLLKIPKQI